MTKSVLTSYSVATSKYSSRQGYSPRRFILHHTAGGGNQGNINLLAHNTSYSVSCNYLSLTTGEIVNIVPEEYRAWTTGWNADRDSITQETVNSGGAPGWPVTDQQIENIARLVADCSRRYGWGTIAYGRNFFVHQNFNSTACPGPYLMDRISTIVNRANVLLGQGGGWEAPATGGSGYPTDVYNGYPIGVIQSRLSASGFVTGIDGIYGPDTTAKVKMFQSSRGLDADGIVGPLTWSALSGQTTPPSALEVDGLWGVLTTKALQRALGVEADGIIGSNTASALQALLGVGVDGDIGPITRRALQARLGVTQDGIWGSDTTRALQTRLNSGSL